MKARIPVSLKRETKKEISRLAMNEYEKVRSKETEDITRRVFKTMFYVLNQKFGFWPR